MARTVPEALPTAQASAPALGLLSRFDSIADTAQWAAGQRNQAGKEVEGPSLLIGFPWTRRCYQASGKEKSSMILPSGTPCIMTMLIARQDVPTGTTVAQLFSDWI